MTNKNKRKIGVNTANVSCKKLGAKIGVANWNRFTAHAYRKYGLTKAYTHAGEDQILQVAIMKQSRHRSQKSALPYKKPKAVHQEEFHSTVHRSLNDQKPRSSSPFQNQKPHSPLPFQNDKHASISDISESLLPEGKINVYELQTALKSTQSLLEDSKRKWEAFNEQEDEEKKKRRIELDTLVSERDTLNQKLSESHATISSLETFKTTTEKEILELKQSNDELRNSHMPRSNTGFSPNNPNWFELARGPYLQNEDEYDWVEAAYVWPKTVNGINYYYLFVNWGECCSGVNSTYKIMVGRSRSPMGPFVDKTGNDLMNGGGSLLLKKTGYMIGPGHMGHYVHDNQEIMTFHYYDSRRDDGLSWIAERKISFQNGWPVAGTYIL